MELKFSLLDYGLFSLLMILSTIIGVYFAFFAKRKQDNTAEYLMGSKQMKIFPVAVSLTATHISAVTILGVPSEMYRFGIQYWASAISGLIIPTVMIYFYLPVFFELQTVTMFSYLEKRFDVKTCRLASCLYSISSITYLPVMIYAPAIAFSQVTGVSLHVITPIMCIICIFYTTFGGIRAVIWTDTLQFISMIGGIGIVMIMGTIYVGGFGNLYDIADRGDRIIWFNMDPDPTSRSTFWSVTVGLTSLWLSTLGVQPECIQRFLSVPTIKDSKKVVWYFAFGHTVVKLLAVFCGIIIFGKYETCDPVTIGEVKKPDQIFPYYVMDIARSIPGLPGIFVAGVFSAALSSLSSVLNTLSGTIWNDFLKPWYPNASEKTSSTIMKIIVFSLGILGLLLVFVVERLGNIFSLAISIVSVTAGTLLGMFTLGMGFTKANRHGAFWGSLGSLVIVLFLQAGAQLAVARGDLNYETLPFRTDGCADLGFPNYENSTGFIGTPNSTIHIYNKNFDNSPVPWIFRLGFMYYSILGTILVFIIGYPVSILTGGERIIDERLFAPIVRRRYVKNLQKLKQKEAERSAVEMLKPINGFKSAYEANYKDNEKC